MYKTVCVIAVLLLALAFTSGSTSPNNLTTPQIVASGKMLNQTTAFSKTLYTPGVSGLYRLSVYATITVADPSSTSNWSYAFSWVDATGTTQTAGQVLTSNDYVIGQFLQPGSFLALGGTSTTFQASKGTPIIHWTSIGGSPDSSAYSVFYTLERLE